MLRVQRKFQYKVLLPIGKSVFYIYIFYNTTDCFFDPFLYLFQFLLLSLYYPRMKTFLLVCRNTLIWFTIRPIALFVRNSALLFQSKPSERYSQSIFRLIELISDIRNDFRLFYAHLHCQLYCCRCDHFI